MKKITLLFNGICLALAIITVIKGGRTSLLLLVIYGMSLGAVLTHQKKTYYYITLVMNGTLLIAGISLMIIYGSKLIKSLNQDYIILIALFLMLILTPILNLIFIKTKMIVLSRMSLRNNQTFEKNGIEKQFKDSLQAIAVSAEEQVAVTEPGDVPEEIIDDYLLWAKSYKDNFSDILNPDIIEDIAELEFMLNKLPESVFKDTNLESMNQPEWQFLREKAKSILDKLNWPIESPSAYIDEGNGTFSRNLTDTMQEKDQMNYFKI